ncbi:hypothetical protein M0R45_015179 [Rubus argutus]|uniref:Major facilitator superfamily (MFS) profile domain-containing protein n=1 Tax=Rubus argutus TaxID=59490 RepID=A0AAW1XQW3_RUBAR
MFYAPVLFDTIGFGSDASLMSAVITGIVNVCATCVAMYCVDKWGRRKLFLEGGIQMLICQIVVATCIGVNLERMEMRITCQSGWLVPSEIFPLEIRSAAQSVNVSVNMIFTFIVAQIFLTMLCHLKFGLFIFRVLCVCHDRLCVLLLARDNGHPNRRYEQVVNNV